MGSDFAIGALALITIGGTLALGIFHFGFQLRSPANREAAKRVAADRESATTRMSAEGSAGRSLRQRLDEAPGINDRLSDRYAGAGMLDAMLDTKWSELRAVLNSNGADRVHGAPVETAQRGASGDQARRSTP